MAWSDYFVWGSDQGQAEESKANFTRLQSELEAQTAARKTAGTISALSAAQNDALANEILGNQNAAYASGFASGLTDFITGASSKDNGDKSPGIGAVLKDLLILAAIGGAVWLFVSFGGFAWLKGFSKKFKWAWAAIVGVAAIVGYFAFSTFKKAGSDASGFAQNVFVNPFKSLFS